MRTGLRAWKGPPVTVFVHAYYPDVWQEMCRLLAARLTVPFRLVLTTPRPGDTLDLPDTPAFLGATVLPVENRGRDILPFLRALAASGDFGIGLKLHTKRSPQREDGARWLAELLDSLLPSPSGTQAILRRMAAEPRAGLVAPAGFSLSVKPWILVNAPNMKRIMSALDHELTGWDLDDTWFAAGSMFWFRRQALARLADPAVADLFEAEHGQLDGTAAHAMERLFPVEARRQGFISLAVPALMASRPAMPTVRLLALARRHADVPSTYFPAPYVAALPPGHRRVGPWLGMLRRLLPARPS